jgi:outer membrane receptor protein involved in Fe transport
VHAAIRASLVAMLVGILGADMAWATDELTEHADIQLETIVVSAQKRTEELKDVPISMSVLGGEQMQQRQITSIDDLARSVPDLAITTYGNTGQSNYAIRGVSSTGGPSTLGQQTVGIYLDDVSMSTPTGASIGSTALKFFDIDRVEVLRGPQGTLYGASSMGGTIRFVSNQPDMTSLGGSVLTSLSDTEYGRLNYVAQSVLNVPLVSNTLALRVGVQVTQDSGWITANDPLTGSTTPHSNKENSDVVRVSLKYQSDDGSLTIVPTVFMQRFNAYGTNLFEPGTHFETTYYSPNESTDKVFIPNLTVQKDLGWADLTSATSYFWRKYDGLLDSTAGLELPVVGFPWPTPFAFPTQVTQPAEELRLASKSMQQSGLPISWIAGLYGSDSHTMVGNYLNLAGSFPAFQQALVNAYGADGAAAFGFAPFGSNLYSQFSHAKIAQYSGFGEFSYAPIQTLIGTVGLRYLVAHETADNTSGGFYNGGISSYITTIHSHALTPKFALRYVVSDTSSVYMNVAKGFRLGGTDLPVPTNTSNPVGAGCLADLQAIGLGTAPVSYKPDSIWSYELGTKSSYFGNRLSVDAAVFHIKWSDVQQDITLNSPQNCAFDFVTNAGQAKSDGVDLELRAKVTQQLTTSIAGNLTHAIITQPAPSTGASDGSWLNGVPRWTASAAGDYAVAVRAATGTANLSGHWVGPSHQGFNSTNSAFEQPSYFSLDGSVATYIEKWRLSLFAKNILNQDKALQQNLNNPQFIQTLRPRTIGISAEAKF